VAGASETAPGPVASAPRRKKKSPVPLYVAGGVAAVGAGVGIAFTLAASSTSDEIDDLRAQVGTGGCQAAPSPACSDLQDAVERRDTQRNASYISFAVAGAAVVAGIVYFVWPTRSTRTSSIGISPLPGGSLVTVAGTL
jgi:uncharacterized membrane protein HdeD (DUF308 family)